MSVWLVSDPVYRSIFSKLDVALQKIGHKGEKKDNGNAYSINSFVELHSCEAQFNE